MGRLGIRIPVTTSQFAIRGLRDAIVENWPGPGPSWRGKLIASMRNVRRA